MIHIDRCYCFQKTFAMLKDIAEQHQCTTIAELQHHLEFGTNCKLCHPYINETLKTGQTVFNQIISKNQVDD